MKRLLLLCEKSSALRRYSVEIQQSNDTTHRLLCRFINMAVQGNSYPWDNKADAMKKIAQADAAAVVLWPRVKSTLGARC